MSARQDTHSPLKNPNPTYSRASECDAPWRYSNFDTKSTVVLEPRCSSHSCYYCCTASAVVGAAHVTTPPPFYFSTAASTRNANTQQQKSYPYTLTTQKRQTDRLQQPSSLVLPFPLSSSPWQKKFNAGPPTFFPLITNLEPPPHGAHDVPRDAQT